MKRDIDEDVDSQLRTIYFVIDDLYQKVKQSGRTDLQQRIAPLRDAATTAWITEQN